MLPDSVYYMDTNVTSILYIEDNQADRMYFLQESKEAGFPFRSDIAASLREAIELLQNNTYQAVVSDFFLGDGKALDLLPHLGDSPLIIITGEGSEEAAVNALKAGAYDYLIKDLNYNYLKIMPITVIKTIEQKKQRDELNRYRTELEKLVSERTNELIALFEKVQESETNFRNIFNGTSDGMFISDNELNILEVNETLMKMFGIDRKFIFNEKLINYVKPSYISAIKERRKLLGKGIPVGNFEIEVHGPNSEKSIPVEISSVPIIFNRNHAVLTIVRDITERKFLSRRLVETIIQTEEEERSRIAKDLHDEIGPLLSALKIYMTSFVDSENIEKKNKLAGQIGVIIRDMIESVKNISNDMSPHVLVNFGLIAAIQNISDIFSRNIDIHFQSNIEQTRFPEIVESVIYRIIKELINNTIKHAQAHEINITLNYYDHVLECSYKDDGTGFDLNNQFNPLAKGMGLSNIKSRIQSLGGQLEMKTSPGKGFELILFLITTSGNHGKQ
jgi:PAS domain S-box-containing protein